MEREVHTPTHVKVLKIETKNVPGQDINFKIYEARVKFKNSNQLYANAYHSSVSSIFTPQGINWWIFAKLMIYMNTYIQFIISTGSQVMDKFPTYHETVKTGRTLLTPALQEILYNLYNSKTRKSCHLYASLQGYPFSSPCLSLLNYPFNQAQYTNHQPHNTINKLHTCLDNIIARVYHICQCQYWV